MSGVRVTEVLAALSLATDLASGVPIEKGLHTCAVATALARELGLDIDLQRAVFHAALLRAVGCTAHAPENAAMFGDDMVFQAALKELDPGDAGVFAEQLARFGSWAGADAPTLRQRFLEAAPAVGPWAAKSGCEVSRALGPRLGLPAAAVAALEDVYERWDGGGIPDGRAGEAISLAGRIVHVAEQAVLAYAHGGGAAATAEIARRAGGHLDPDLAESFVRCADELLAPMGESDALATVLAAEPGPVALVGPGELEPLCLALSVVADLKGTYLLGHSAHVADLAGGAARLSGVPPADREGLNAAALLHDLGRVAVPSSVWDRPGRLSAVEREQARLHSYWTERILLRCPALAPLGQIAAAHHECLDGSGYHRGARAGELSDSARLLAAADTFATLTEPRPYGPAYALADAARLLSIEVSEGRQDAAAAASVIETAGLARPRLDWPCDLTDREVDVLRLAARGKSNRDIATDLVISERTVGHHLAHIFDKTGRRTRAGAAVFAIEHGLLPGEPR